MRFTNLLMLLLSYIIIDQAGLYADINIYEHIMNEWIPRSDLDFTSAKL